MISPSGNPIKNQNISTTGSVQVFTSYGKHIAIKSHGGLVYVNKDYWDYSQTTLKYFKQFAGLDMPKRKLQTELHDSDYTQLLSNEEMLEQVHQL